MTEGLNMRKSRQNQMTTGRKETLKKLRAMERTAKTEVALKQEAFNAASPEDVIKARIAANKSKRIADVEAKKADNKVSKKITINKDKIMKGLDIQIAVDEVVYKMKIYGKNLPMKKTTQIAEKHGANPSTIARYAIATAQILFPGDYKQSPVINETQIGRVQKAISKYI